MQLDDHKKLKEFTVKHLISLAPVNLQEINESKHYWVAKMLKDEQLYDILELMEHYG
jgi:hypothetical protein